MKKNSGNSIQSWILVFIQFTCIALLVFSGPALLSSPYLLTIEIFSILFGVWSALAMKPGTLNVFPEVREGATFITRGPYRLIRHPMYLSVLLFCFSLVAEEFTIRRLSIFLILTICLLYKIEYEEKILTSKFEGYQEYRSKSKKLIPFIY